MVAREVALTVTGLHSGKSLGQLELFTEESSSVLIHENGGVIQMSADVLRGQLLLLRNLEAKREVIAQVKRTYKPMNRCVDLDFVEPVPRFWGMEFSAATALLPKSAKDQEAAALLSADPNPAESAAALPAPTPEEIDQFKCEVQALRGDNPLSPNSPDIEHEQAPFELTPTERDLLPRPSLDFSVPPPKKGLFRARGKLTPGAGLRLALLTAALLATIVAAVWITLRIPSRSALKGSTAPAPAVGSLITTSVPTPAPASAKEPSKFTNSKVTIDAPQPTKIPASEPSKPSAATSSASQPSEPDSSSVDSGRTTSSAPLPKSSQPLSKPIVPAASSSDSSIIPPKLIKSVLAVASLEDTHDFETGNVVIDAVVDTEGDVHFISVLSGPPSLRRAAVRAVKDFKYEPATRNGQPVPERVHITIRFRFES